MTKTLSLRAGAVATAVILLGTLAMFSYVSADSSAFDFESYSLGTINAQDGWSSTGAAGSGCAIYDHAVSSSLGTAGFGSQSLRISNAVTSGCFGDQTFSKSLVNEAGEADSTSGSMSGGVRQPHFEAQFDFVSASSTQQPGLFMSVSPDRGDGSRMSYLGFSDEPGGIDVIFYDTPGTTNPATFSPTTVATGLSRTAVHTAKFVIDYVDGPSNDVVKIYIDGVLVHTGTTWENYFRYDSEASAEQSPRTTDDLIFRSGGGAAPATAGKGYLIDNLSLLSGPTPPGSIVITKYACPTDTVVTRLANGVGGTVPSGCALEAGKTFGYVHGTQTDANAPYPELSAPLTAGGSTNGSGVLTISPLPADGRYLVVETDGSNVQLPAGDILGLYCVGDGDTSGTNDNQELTFVPSGGTVNCVAYNKAAPPPPADVTVTIVKYISGVHATSGNANSASFPMVSSWDAVNLGGVGNGTYPLSTVGFNTPNPYEAVTSNMTNGSDYTTNEDLTTPVVGANCASGQQFRHAGYTTGDTLALAQGGTLSSTTPAFTNFTTDKWVIVWNEPCPTGPTPPPVTACATPTVAPAGFTLQNGTAGNNTVVLAPQTMFVGLGGNDKVTGPNGNYIVCLGAGNDKVTLGDGDVIIDGGGGNDTIIVGTGTGTIVTGAGNDKITTGNGDHTITSDGGNDTIVTGSGVDTINAGDGNNKVNSGGGDDSITALGGNDKFDGGAGAADTCSADGGFNVLLNCEL